MKIIISESQYKLINENISLKEKLLGLIKKVGFESVTKIVGSLDKTFEIFDIKEPMDFLHLFDDLEVTQSDEYEDWTLYRYMKGNNIMTYNGRTEVIYINYNEIWSVLENKFGLNYSETQELIHKWLGKVYNLRGVTPYDDVIGGEPSFVRFTN
jgi:hypothetical protein